MNTLTIIFWLDLFALGLAACGIMAAAKHCRDEDMGFLDVCAMWWLLHLMPLIWLCKGMIRVMAAVKAKRRKHEWVA